MRGPLLVGAIGSPATLDRVAALVRDKAPAVVLSAVWLGVELSTAFPVTLLCEPEARRAAKRALKKASGAGQKLSVVVAGETLPVLRRTVGALLVEGLADTNEEDAITFLLGLAPSLEPGGIVVALDGTKDPAAEARVAGFFLAAGLRGVRQERPKEGALLTRGSAPLAEALAVRTGVRLVPQVAAAPGASALAGAESPGGDGGVRASRADEGSAVASDEEDVPLDEPAAAPALAGPGTPAASDPVFEPPDEPRAFEPTDDPRADAPRTEESRAAAATARTPSANDDGPRGG